MGELCYLRHHDVFGVFTDAQLSKLAEITEKRTYKKREHIYQRGNRATHIYLVHKGLVSLRDIGSGDLVGIAYETCGPGELFGIASFMKPHEHSLTAVCLEDSEVLAIEAARLLEFCEKEPGLGNWFMLAIAELYFKRYQHCKKQLFDMVKTPTIITALPG
jgi:CRP-like cAMP-binding protein